MTKDSHELHQLGLFGAEAPRLKPDLTMDEAPKGSPMQHVTEPEANPDVLQRQLAEVAAQAATCTRCRLHKSRTHSVFSDGSPHARLMLIGEGPGQNEDETGVPFVGRAGQLLTKILESVGINRQTDIYICNIVKCRPPQNRTPEPDEAEACSGYLQAQLALIRPSYVLLAGATAVRGILGKKEGITRLRGQWFDLPFQDRDGNTARAMPVFHPSYLLRNQSREKGSPKWLTWQDMQAVRQALDAL